MNQAHIFIMNQAHIFIMNQAQFKSIDSIDSISYIF